MAQEWCFNKNMRFVFLHLFVLSAHFFGIAQTDFTGIAKYKITVEGSGNPVTDSMSIIFDKQRVKVVLYLPGMDSGVSEKIFIDDFSAKKSMALNEEAKTFKTDTLNANGKYNFINTQRVVASSINMLCFQYTAERGSLDTLQILSADCFAGIDYRNSAISNYSFLGIQPIIVDNRIVMDFIITLPDGIKQKTYISEIKRMPDVESYFDLSSYSPQ